MGDAHSRSFVVGPYRCQRHVGQGLYGVVYQAEDVRTGGKVAVKCLTVRPGLEPTPLLRVAATMPKHPGIVVPYDYIVPARDTEETKAYLVTPWLDGWDLADYLSDHGGTMPVELALDVFAQCASALACAAQSGVVHRNIKPGNIFICRDRSAKVLDFGLSADMMRGSEARGAVACMAPDFFQVDGFRGDEVSDVYSFGVCLYVALSGDTTESLARADSWEAARLLRLAGGGLDYSTMRDREVFRWHPDLAHLVMRCVATEREERYQHFEEISRDLASLSRRLGPWDGPPTRTSLDASMASALGLDGGVFDGNGGDGGDGRDGRDGRGDRPPPFDDDVQFTVYRPRVVVPKKRYSLLAFAHVSEWSDRAVENPVTEVKRQATAILGGGAHTYENTTQDSVQSVPLAGELTMVPWVEGLTFRPARQSFLWEETVHRADFRFWAAAELVDHVARGRLTVYLGSIILAEVPLRIEVRREEPASADNHTRDTAKRFRRIFASYSHDDLHVVQEFERYAKALGDRYLRDWIDLRCGEPWSARLEEMIEQADVFQLFWSRNSMRSDFVRREYEFARALGRNEFIKPVFWEQPLPADTTAGLPPDWLLALHFEPILGDARRRQSLFRRLFANPAFSLTLVAIVLAFAVAVVARVGLRVNERWERYAERSHACNVAARAERAGNWGAAVAAYDQALSLAPESERAALSAHALSATAHWALAQGRWDTAVAKSNEMLATNPDDSVAQDIQRRAWIGSYSATAETAVARQDWQGALSALGKAQELAGDDPYLRELSQRVAYQVALARALEARESEKWTVLADLARSARNVAPAGQDLSEVGVLQRLGDTMVAATAARVAADWPKLRELTANVLDTDPGSKDARRWHTKATVEMALADARQALAARRWDDVAAAARNVDAATAGDPDHFEFEAALAARWRRQAAAAVAAGSEVATGPPKAGANWALPVMDMPFIWLPECHVWIGQYEVSQSQGAVYWPDRVAALPEQFRGAELPMVDISFEDATAFAAWLTDWERRAGRLPAYFVYRLPTGSEWTEAVCNGGAVPRFPWGDAMPPTRGNYADAALHAANPDHFAIPGYRDGYPYLAPVAASGANDRGIYGLGGNVWEWVIGGTPRWRKGEGFRDARGGAWDTYAANELTTNAEWPFPELWFRHSAGFRLVLGPAVEDRE